MQEAKTRLSELLREVEEGAEIGDAGEGVLARAGLVQVPRHVGLDGVQAHEPRGADPVGPLVGVHPEVVQRPADHLEGAAVEQEVPLADLERGHGVVEPFGQGDDESLTAAWTVGATG